ncbi:hypothetical protein [Crenobacter cavernae]|uniref:Uncharacterized protein n=1 Tax=Crenobacter cavernae TaxID=2290923 RepID=A0ABY0FI87_9NEIS|nr:hypothetical protein [Crenobacter cavernae]RXZ44661.1 hypothetical protein EBB06_06085 [Crenobacter cavernae]
MKTRLALVALLLVSQPVWALRPLPADLRLGQLSGASGVAVSIAPPETGVLDALLRIFVVKEASYLVTPALRVYDPENKMVLTGDLPQWVGSRVGVTLDFMGNVNRVWVLTAEEYAARMQQLEASPQ